MNVNFINVALCAAMLALMSACRQSSSRQAQSEQQEYSFEADTIPDEGVAEDTHKRFEDSASLLEYLEEDPEAAAYAGGIIPVIAENVPEYADKLLANEYDKFIVVDKASLRVILYDKYGQELRAYDMACAKNYGNKHKKGDSRTPEGFFYVQGTYDSTDWLFTDDNGVQSKKKGQFGPRFIRLRIPGTSQIGIHGTCAPWSIGHRVSHGCIRILNENILELVDLVEPGMPAIILPGKRDRKVNREEGCFVPYFPTAPKYAMTESEKTHNPKKKEESEYQKLADDSIKAKADTIGRVDSINNITESNTPTESNKSKEPNDSITD